MGGHYAARRNYDLGRRDRLANGSGVSCLSPWVRHRRLLEPELVDAALDRFSLSTAEKFVQEVCWRTYFKGWLEHRPSVWSGYQDGVRRRLDDLNQQPELRADYDAAVRGQTGIYCFDAWVRELVETGYLHNHARMWFASIWIFTLELPWELGADWFLQHLMDGDAASNTCSWRWVGGLHTLGKTYLARRSNIETYTQGLAAQAPPLHCENPPPMALPANDPWPEGDVALLLTEEDLHDESLRPVGATVRALAGAHFAADRSPHGAGEIAETFTNGALADALACGQQLFECPTLRLRGDETFLSAATEWARSSGCATVVTGFAPVGWVKPHLDALRRQLARHDINLIALQRPWDAAFWPHARKGFFGLKKVIPQILEQLRA